VRQHERHVAHDHLNVVAQRGVLSALDRTMRAGTGERASLAYDA
jgi:hypothetical protein